MTATVVDERERLLRPLRIAVTADPELPVPPRLYGGIERIVDMLVTGLQERGHQVTLIAHRDSRANVRRVAYGSESSRGATAVLRNLFLVNRHVRREGHDVVHSFGRLAYVTPLLRWHGAKLQSYQRAISARSVRWGERLSAGTLHFAGCSRALIGAYATRPNWHVVPNGVPVGRYRFHPRVADEAPLVFLGRVEEIKGPHLAIEIARRSGRRLLLAGNVPHGPQHRRFFDEQIRPHLDEDRVRYLGAVDDAAKSTLLGEAAALLMPILWEEPFGIVMAEALACGTPVVGLRRGAVPEVVDHQRTGFVENDVDGCAAAARRLHEVDRRACRVAAEERFSDRAVVDAYEDLYRRLVVQCSRVSAR